MQKFTFVFSILLFSTQLIFSQSSSLVEDYIPGIEGSIDGRIYNFQNILTYMGTTQDGARGILQYDKSSGEITELATEDDFDGELISLTSNTEEMVVLTGEGTSAKHIYRSEETDFSDLIKLYSSGEADIRTFRFHEKHTLLLEEIFDGFNYTTNIKVIDPDGEVQELYNNLPGRTNDFTFTALNRHFVFAPELELIEGNSILAYNIDTKAIVPFTNIVPDFEECGLISRVASLNQSVIYYFCDNEYLYDVNTESYVDYGGGSFFLTYDKDEFIFMTINDSFYKINKATGERILLIDNITTSRALFSSYIILTDNNGLLDISLFNFEEEKMYTYPTDYPSDKSYRLTGLADVPAGVHIVIYETQEDNGIIININSDSFTQIDSVYNVNFRNRPVATEFDIYFTHQDPEFGNELFVIDYTLHSTQEFAQSSLLKISPNPSFDHIQITHEDGLTPSNTSIYSINGAVLDENANHNTIDVSNFNSGIYFLTTTYTNGETTVEKFIVER